MSPAFLEGGGGGGGGGGGALDEGQLGGMGERCKLFAFKDSEIYAKKSEAFKIKVVHVPRLYFNCVQCKKKVKTTLV